MASKACAGVHALTRFRGQPAPSPGGPAAARHWLACCLLLLDPFAWLLTSLPQLLVPLLLLLLLVHLLLRAVVIAPCGRPPAWRQPTPQAPPLHSLLLVRLEWVARAGYRQACEVGRADLQLMNAQEGPARTAVLAVHGLPVL